MVIFSGFRFIDYSGGRRRVRFADELFAWKPLKFRFYYVLLRICTRISRLLRSNRAQAAITLVGSILSFN